jgi:alkylated DNA repair dioxygenase AlkB
MVYSLVDDFLLDDEIDEIMDELKNVELVPKLQRSSRNKLVASSNLYRWVSELDIVYGFSKTHLNPFPAHPWGKALRNVKKMVEVATGKAYNSVLINYYPNGSSKLSAHSDNDGWLGDDFDVPSISLGATRVMRFSVKKGKKTPRGWVRRYKDVTLQNGSLCVMQGKDAQANFTHAILESKEEINERFNLTFRNVTPDLVDLYERGSGSCRRSDWAEVLTNVNTVILNGCEQDSYDSYRRRWKRFKDTDLAEMLQEIQKERRKSSRDTKMCIDYSRQVKRRDYHFERHWQSRVR